MCVWDLGQRELLGRTFLCVCLSLPADGRSLRVCCLLTEEGPASCQPRPDALVPKGILSAAEGSLGSSTTPGSCSLRLSGTFWTSLLVNQAVRHQGGQGYAEGCPAWPGTVPLGLGTMRPCSLCAWAVALPHLVLRGRNV